MSEQPATEGGKWTGRCVCWVSAVKVSDSALPTLAPKLLGVQHAV